MNTQRRKDIENVQKDIQELKSRIEDIQSEEQDYFDNMPESLQRGEKGDLSQAAIDALQSAIDAADEADGYLSEAIS